MKAPTADYSSLSQALSAKNNALQSSYAAKDASNWKSSYDIQQKSFDLSKKALSLQEENTKYNGIANLVSSLGTLASKVAGWGEEIYTAQQDKGKQELTKNATQMSSEWETLLNMNPDFMTEFDDPVTGAKTLGLSEKGQAAYEKLEAKYFPSDTKYGWGLDDTAEQLKQNLRVSAVSYAQSLALSNVQGQADVAYSYNLDYARNLDLESGETDTVTVSDGNGGTRTLTIGKQTKALIDSRSNMGESWQANQYEVEASNLITSRQERIISDLTEGYTSGTYITDPTAREASNATIAAHLDAITDPIKRASAESAIKSTISNGIQTHFTNRVNSIMAQDTDSYAALKELYDSVSTVGSFSLKSLFYDKNGKENPYVDNLTLSNVRSVILSEMSAIEEMTGTTATNTVSNGLALINSQLKAGTLSPEGWVGSFKNIMAEAYGADWTLNEEAQKVFNNTVLSLLPDDLTSDPAFTAAWNIAVGTMFKMDYKELDSEQQGYAIMAQSNMMNDLMAAVVKDPTVAIDPNKYATTLTKIASKYNAKWLDTIDDTFTADYWKTLGGNEAEKVFKSEITKILNTYSSEIEDNLNVIGVWDRSDDNLPRGINNKVSEFITSLGTYSSNKYAELIADPRAGAITFGKYSSNGQLFISRVSWDGVEINGLKGKVIFDVSRNEWRTTYDTPTQTSQPTTAGTSSSKVGAASIKTTTVGETTAATIKNVESGNVYKASSTSADTAVSTVDNDIETFITMGMNNATDAGLEKFLWDMATDETRLDETVEELKARHDNKEYVPGMKEAEYDKWVNGIADKVRTNKGWTKVEEEATQEAEEVQTQETPAEDTPISSTYESTKAWAEKNPKPDLAAVATLLENADDVDSVGNDLKILAKEGIVTLPNGNSGLVDEFIDLSVATQKENRNKRIQEEQPQEESAVEATVSEWTEENPTPTVEDIVELLASDTTEDIDSVVEVLKEEAASGEITLPTAENMTEEQTLDNVVSAIKANNGEPAADHPIAQATVGETAQIVNNIMKSGNAYKSTENVSTTIKTESSQTQSDRDIVDRELKKYEKYNFVSVDNMVEILMQCDDIDAMGEYLKERYRKGTLILKKSSISNSTIYIDSAVQEAKNRKGNK